jgi:hypothetical protein
LSIAFLEEIIIISFKSSCGSVNDGKYDFFEAAFVLVNDFAEELSNVFGWAAIGTAAPRREDEAVVAVFECDLTQEVNLFAQHSGISRRETAISQYGFFGSGCGHAVNMIRPFHWGVLKVSRIAVKLYAPRQNCAKGCEGIMATIKVFEVIAAAKELLLLSTGSAFNSAAWPSPRTHIQEKGTHAILLGVDCNFHAVSVCNFHKGFVEL